MTSAKAFPPCSPAYHAWMMASHVSSCSGTRATALPEQFTRITFLPAWCNAFRMSRCTCGSSMLVRSPPSKPGKFTLACSRSTLGEIPPTKTTVSACCACARISGIVNTFSPFTSICKVVLPSAVSVDLPTTISCTVMSVMLHAVRYGTAPTFDWIPSNGVTVCVGFPK